MSMRSPRGASRGTLAGRLLSIALVLFPTIAGAQEKWRSVPATPVLPAAASSGYVERKDARLWYAAYGSEGDPAVLLLHGGGGSSDYWAHLVRGLAHDYRVVVFDIRGQGRSTNEATAISYEQMAEDAVAVLDAVAIKHAAVVGWSDGANVGFYLALKHPERISALVAFAGNATPAGYQANANPATMASYVARTKTEYQKLSPKPERHAATMRALSLMWRTQPTLTPKDLAAIKVRTAIIHAEHDEVIRRAHSQEIAAQIPNARFVLLRGVSHFALLQDPAGFHEAVRSFLAWR